MNRIQLRQQLVRRGFTVVFDELWTDYLPHIGGQGALLYCFLKFRVGQDIPNPCSHDWEHEVCKTLGMSVADSHGAWARLQEMGLIVLSDGAYELCDPTKLSLGLVAVGNGAAPAQSLYAEVEMLFGRVLGSSEIARLEELAEEYPHEHVVLAVQAAAQEQALSFPYVARVLADWKRRKLTTSDAIRVYLDERRQAKLSKEIVKGRRNTRMPQTRGADLMTYDDSELILKRMKQAARGED